MSKMSHTVPEFRWVQVGCLAWLAVALVQTHVRAQVPGWEAGPQFPVQATVVAAPLPQISTETPPEGNDRPEDLETLVERLKETESRLESLEEYKTKKETKEKEEAEKKAQESKAAKEKKKAWYEKLSIRGYAQVRYNDTLRQEAGSFPAHLVGDSSVGTNQEFLIRRARLIVFGDVNDHLGVYLQPDFASSVPNAGEANHFAQIRDWYGDLYIDTDKVHRLRIGQSKIPYGWENMQSSSNRIPLDRNDALNSAARNERDLGVFYYWTPEPAQEFFKYVIDEGLKGSGNYGVFGFGVYNGQGGSLRERNDNLHVIARLTLPGCLPNGQRYEVAMQGYTGRYVVTTDPILQPNTNITGRPLADPKGTLDERLAWTFVYYPQPWGWQAEWTVGNGPSLNEAQTEIGSRSLSGGYIQTMYRIENDWGVWFPFARYNHYRGGYKSERNAPYAQIDEWETGIEWQINSNAELVTMLTLTDRTNTVAGAVPGLPSYGQFEGSLWRTQFQFSY